MLAVEVEQFARLARPTIILCGQQMKALTQVYPHIPFREHLMVTFSHVAKRRIGLQKQAHTHIANPCRKHRENTYPPITMEQQTTIIKYIVSIPFHNYKNVKKEASPERETSFVKSCLLYHQRFSNAITAAPVASRK